MIPFSALYAPEAFAATVAASFSLEEHRQSAKATFYPAFELKLRSLYRDGRISPISSLVPLETPEVVAWDAFAASGHADDQCLDIFGRDLIGHACIDVDFADPRLKRNERIKRAYFALCGVIDTGTTTPHWRFDRLRNPTTNERYILRFEHWRAYLTPYSDARAAA